MCILNINLKGVFMKTLKSIIYLSLLFVFLSVPISVHASSITMTEYCKDSNNEKYPKPLTVTIESPEEFNLFLTDCLTNGKEKTENVIFSQTKDIAYSTDYVTVNFEHFSISDKEKESDYIVLKYDTFTNSYVENLALVQNMKLGDIVLPAINQEYSSDFYGIYEGNHHSIRGFISANISYENQGIFGTIHPSGVVQNLSFSDCFVCISSGGCFSKRNQGTIQNCLITNSYFCNPQNNIPTRTLSAFSGTNSGTITNCYVTNSTLVNRGSSKGIVAGITGQNTGDIQECYVSDVQFESENCEIMGGIIGKQTIMDTSHIKNNHILKSHLNRGYIVGGIVGLLTGSVSEKNAFSIMDCSTTAQIDLSDKMLGHYVYGGGIVGQIQVDNPTTKQKVIIESCCNLGNPSFTSLGDSKPTFYGGILGGSNTGTAIDKCLSNQYCTVLCPTENFATSCDGYYGGIAGSMYCGRITNCTDSSNMKLVEEASDTAHSTIGGLIGLLESSSDTLIANNQISGRYRGDTISFYAGEVSNQDPKEVEQNAENCFIQGFLESSDNTTDLTSTSFSAKTFNQWIEKHAEDSATYCGWDNYISKSGYLMLTFPSILDSSSAIRRQWQRTTMSNPVSPLPKPTIKPETPDNLLATAMSKKEIHLSWLPQKGVTKYLISRSAKNKNNFKQLVYVSGNTGTYKDATCTKNTLYYYKIAAIYNNQIGPAAITSSKTYAYSKGKIKCKKLKIKKQKYLKILPKKCEGSHLELYIQKGNSGYKKTTLKKKSLTHYMRKGILISYKNIKGKIHIKIRTTGKIHGEKCYSPFSKEITVKL